MKRMATLKDHERRITALESRSGKIDEVLAYHSESLYVLKRAAIKTDLRLGSITTRLDLKDITEEQVDEVLDAE